MRAPMALLLLLLLLLLLSLPVTDGGGGEGLRTCHDPELAKLPFCDASLPVRSRRPPPKVALVLSDGGADDGGTLRPGQVALRVEDLLPRLNTTQRIQQMQMVGPAVPELGIIEYDYGGEALHGVWSTCVNTTAGRKKCPTQFGAPLAMGCSFNRRLWRAMASATSTEARALYSLGPGSGAASLEGPLGLSYYAPNVNIMRVRRPTFLCGTS